jgi:hypothetical protein
MHAVKSHRIFLTHMKYLELIWKKLTLLYFLSNISSYLDFSEHTESKYMFN